MMQFLLQKSREPSTWKGIIWILTAFGLVFDEDQREAIAAFGMTLSGLISVFLEKGTAHSDQEIIEMVKNQQEKTAEAVKQNKKRRKDAKNEIPPVDSDDFFGDGMR